MSLKKLEACWNTGQLAWGKGQIGRALVHQPWNLVQELLAGEWSSQSFIAQRR
jgi:hypothetical protein